MFGFMEKKLEKSTCLSDAVQTMQAIYDVKSVDDKRKEYLKNLIENNGGYVPYPYFKVLDEFSEGEIIFCLTEILSNQTTNDENEFKKMSKSPSILKRTGQNNPSWFQKEGHNIKLISLSALGDGNKSEETADFINWIAQLITLPKGSKESGIMADTIYLLPFHPREFGCAYLPSSSEVSSVMEDKRIAKFLGLNGEEQVKLFISIAQMCSHPVIYDVLPQTARFSKIILSHPYAARWADIKELLKEVKDKVYEVTYQFNASGEFSKEVIDSVKDKYVRELEGEIDAQYTDIEKPVFEKLNALMKDIKIELSNNMSLRKTQEILSKRAQDIINSVNGKKVHKEEDIIKHNETTKALIDNGLWPNPGGAWCSAYVPVFDKMNKGKDYPLYKHYDYKGVDVTHFANLDCQTPYYFAYLENGEYNNKVVDFYIDYLLNLQEKYNFDGFRVDHIDHIVDSLSERDGKPISYRIPRKVLGKVNSALKSKIPYFATLAEYMLWDDYYKEYNQDMKFDVLWGNDIIAQSSKTPKAIIQDNNKLEKYNFENQTLKMPLSFLKTYNNQDGEFEAIDRYPAQLGKDGALFKWFKYKFLPGGSYAQRPSLYIDGDESFTNGGIEYVIGREVSMKRNNDLDFYEKFNAINYFSQHSKILSSGKAKLLMQEDNGLCAWEVNSKFGSLLVIANYKNPSEKTEVKNEDGSSHTTVVYGEPVYNNLIKFGQRKLKTYFSFERNSYGVLEFKEKNLDNLIENEITMNVLNPAEFKVYGYDE